MEPRVWDNALLNDIDAVAKKFSSVFRDRGAARFTGRECIDWMVKEFNVSRVDGCVLGQILLRNHVFFAVGDNFELEDDTLVQFKLCGSGNIALSLMGLDGTTLKSSPLCMNMFDSVASLCKEKVVTMRSGRHTFEIRAAVVDVGAPALDLSTTLSSTAALAEEIDMHSDECRILIDEGKARASSGDRCVSLVLRNRDEMLTQIQSVLRTDEDDQVGSDFASLGLADQILMLMGSKSKLDLFCSLVLDANFDASTFNGETHDGLSLLHVACLTGRSEVVKKVMESAAQVSFASSQVSILHCAVIGGSKEVTKAVLTQFSEDEARTLLRASWAPHNLTALHVSCLLGFADTTAVILARAQELHVSLLDTRDAFGSTALINACFSGAGIVAKLLIQSGASLDSLDEQGNSCLMIAVARKFSDLVLLLLSAKPSLAVLSNAQGDSPLWLALVTGNLDAIEMLAEHTASTVNSSLPGNVNRNTLLHRAVAFLPDYLLHLVIPSLNLRRTVEQLPNAQQLLPLHLAILLGKTQAASALSLCIPAALEVDAYGDTPLHLAVTGRAVDWVMTHYRPANMEARNGLSFTALMTCCAVGSRHAISALLANGCDLGAMNEANKRTALFHLELRSLSKLVLPFDHESRPTGIFVMGNVVDSTPSSVSSSPLTSRKNKLLGGSASDSPTASPTTGRKLRLGGSLKMKSISKKIGLGTLKF